MAILADINVPILIGTVFIIAISTFFLFGKRKSQESVVDLDDLLNSEEQWSTEEKGKARSKKSHSTSKDINNTGDLKNVFDVHQPPPNVGKAEKDDGEKPFKSSYYYAHNHLKKTGGYKDGLKAQDYVMNGPKLLAKGGKSVLDDGNGPNSGASEEKPASAETKAEASTTPAVSQPAKTSLGSIAINRYLWDDDGNKDGVAKIYITTLPGKSTASPTINWEDGNVSKSDVASKLIGQSKNGLIVQIRADAARYHLYVPRLYGEVKEMKTIVKSKKLIIKLTKKSTVDMKAWPQLPSKVKPSTTEDHINQDLFLEEK